MSHRSFVRRGHVLAAVAVIVALITGGCSSGDSAAATTPQSSDPGAAAFPVTIKHALGTTTIEKKPTRIVTLDEDLDTLAAVGVTPVAYAPTAPGYSDDVPYLADRIDLSKSTVLKQSENGQFSLEQIAAAKPDLILATNLYGVDKMYDTLSQIAPTIAYEKGWGQTSWQDMSLTIGKAIGKESAAKQAVAKTEKYLSDLKAELPGLAGKTVAGAYYHTSGTFAANPRSASMSKYEALGMVVAPKLLEQLPEGSTGNSISLESIDVLDTDFLALSFGSDQLRDELESNPLYQKLHVVQNGGVYVNDPDDPLPTYAGNNPTLLNIVWLLDAQKKTLAKVATNA